MKNNIRAMIAFSIFIIVVIASVVITFSFSYYTANINSAANINININIGTPVSASFIGTPNGSSLLNLQITTKNMLSGASGISANTLVIANNTGYYNVSVTGGTGSTTCKFYFDVSTCGGTYTPTYAAVSQGLKEITLTITDITTTSNVTVKAETQITDCYGSNIGTQQSITANAGATVTKKYRFDVKAYNLNMPQNILGSNFCFSVKAAQPTCS